MFVAWRPRMANINDKAAIDGGNYCGGVLWVYIEIAAQDVWILRFGKLLDCFAEKELVQVALPLVARGARYAVVACYRQDLGLSFDKYLRLYPPARVVQVFVSRIHGFVDDSKRLLGQHRNSSAVSFVRRTCDHGIFPLCLVLAWFSVFDVPALGLHGGRRLANGVWSKLRFLQRCDVCVPTGDHFGSRAE